MPPTRENKVPSGPSSTPVVRQDIERAVVSEGVVERRREDQHVRGQHTAGVHGHHQRASAGRQRFQAVYFCPKIPFDDRPHRILDLPGKHRIPLRGVRVVASVHGAPLR